MDSLSETLWDVLISGTGLPQSLLALALSRSGKKILHVDRNDYYGGAEAALSLQEAEEWVGRVNEESEGYATFSKASLRRSEESSHGAKLSFPRAYSLTLSPQLIYTQSALIPAMVASKVYKQLEFQAVGSWWICRSMLVEPEDDPPPPEELQDQDPDQEPPKKKRKAMIQRVPNGREDLIPDTTIEFRAKMALVKFLNAVAKPDELPELEDADAEAPLSDYLERKFRLAASLHPAIHGISLSSGPVGETRTGDAIPRIRRHLRSIGVFGPGFGAVVPKWGCLAEVAQVACRAGAVGGAVYVLGKGVKSIERIDEKNPESSEEGRLEGEGGFEVELSDGEKIKMKWIAGSAEDLPAQPSIPAPDDPIESTRSITIVASTLDDLFPTVAEGGPPPAGAVVVVPGESGDIPPVYLLIHSSDTGECPAGQSVIYASTSFPAPAGHTLLETAISTLLESQNPDSSPPLILFSLTYTQHSLPTPLISTLRTVLHAPQSPDGAVLTIPPPSLDLAFEDAILEDVRALWMAIMGPDVAEEEFLRFEEREGMGGENDDDGDGE